MDLLTLQAHLPEQLLQWLPLEGEAKTQAALALLAVALAAACLLLGRLAGSLARGTARWVRVAAGTRTVPAAPGGLPLLGHALSLATAPCPWERMLEWARLRGPLTRFSILHRTGLIVNDPAGAKRIFQVGARAPVGCGRLAGTGGTRLGWVSPVRCLHRCSALRGPRHLLRSGAGQRHTSRGCQYWDAAARGTCPPPLPTPHASRLHSPPLADAARMSVQTKQKLYDKDLDFSYKPFLSILGTGLVTANGAHWQKQRLLMVRPAARAAGPPLRAGRRA